MNKFPAILLNPFPYNTRLQLLKLFQVLSTSAVEKNDMSNVIKLINIDMQINMHMQNIFCKHLEIGQNGLFVYRNFYHINKYENK